MGNGIECELEGVANGFATPSLKLRRPRDLRLEAVPHHKVHYIQTAINQVIIFQTTSLSSNSIKISAVSYPFNLRLKTINFCTKKEGKQSASPP